MEPWLPFEIVVLRELPNMAHKSADERTWSLPGAVAFDWAEDTRLITGKGRGRECSSGVAGTDSCIAVETRDCMRATTVMMAVMVKGGCVGEVVRMEFM